MAVSPRQQLLPGTISRCIVDDNDTALYIVRNLQPKDALQAFECVDKGPVMDNNQCYAAQTPHSFLVPLERTTSTSERVTPHHCPFKMLKTPAARNAEKNAVTPTVSGSHVSNVLRNNRRH